MSKVKDRKGGWDEGDDRQGLGPVIDSASSTRIAVNRGPISDLVISPDGARLLVTSHGRHSVSAIDTDTFRVVGTVEGLSEPFAIAMGGDRAFVSTVSWAYDAVAVLDPRAATVVATHPLTHRVSDVAASRDGTRIYAGRTGADGGDLAVVDVASGRVETVGLPVSRRATTARVCVGPDGPRLYVAVNAAAAGQLFVLRTDGVARVVGSIRIRGPIRDVALSPDGVTAYVASDGPEGPRFDVVDTRSYRITRTRNVGDVGGFLTGLTVSGDGDRAYVVSDTAVTVLCTLTHDIVGVVAVTDHPSRAVESPDGKWLYVADYAGSVTATPVAAITGQEGADDAAAEGLMLPDLLPREPAFV